MYHGEGLFHWTHYRIMESIGRSNAFYTYRFCTFFNKHRYGKRNEVGKEEAVC